jgi:hypothetical protein
MIQAIIILLDVKPIKRKCVMKIGRSTLFSRKCFSDLMKIPKKDV